MTDRYIKILLGMIFLVPNLMVAQMQVNQKPNIVFIMADDLGIGDIGCYGQEILETPHIDKLAQEGMRFTQAYAGSSVCAPSRSSLMTGMHNGHNRVRDNIPHGVFLLPDDLTVAEVLKQAGYKTGGIGKWGLGNPGSWGVPNYQGFDYYYGQLNQDQAHYYYPDYMWENDKIDLLFENRGEKKGAYTHNIFMDKAINFIDDNKSNPFFLYLSLTLPHFSDYDERTADSHIVPSNAKYASKDWPEVEKNYATMVDMIDQSVGQIMEKLKQLGLDSNTIVFFTSDNGPNRSTLHDIDFFNSNGIYKGGKRDMYEGGIRIPMVVRWPDKIKAGTVSDQVWAFWDFLPTAAEMAGLPFEREIDGVSVLPTLLGKEQSPLHKYLYWDYGHSREIFMQAVRWNNWKGVRNGQGTELELYDLNVDPGEKNDLASKEKDVLLKLESFIKEAYVPSSDYPMKMKE
ncbi:arylsulfatase [Flagellimonas amoyensis]|uniref:arylsulfatase n=1 Tax=Flagellimonas amoyensis TaxID=2169401 RepID=UPI00131F1AC9|nr:arylsulfatase [Allomuricauda amoyensis]